MATTIKAYYETFSWMCKMGYLGPVPEELRSVPIYFGVFLLLFSLPLLMRKATIWRMVLMAWPVYWFGLAAYAAWDVPRPGKPSEIEGLIMMLLFLASYGLGLSAVIFNKGYRIATAGLVAANGYVTFFTAFISGMAMTGKWI